MINFNPNNFVLPQKGKILISEPFLNDPYFKRTVVLICDYNNQEGTFGFILNRYLDVDLSELLNDWPESDIRISMGGPVEPNSLYFLHSRPDLFTSNQLITENIYLGTDFSNMKQYISLDIIKKNEIRFFLGYSGWGAGQLESEIEEKAWIVAAASSDLLMNTADDRLWQTALSNLGRDFAILANFPEDPSLN